MSCHDIGRGLNSVVRKTIKLMDQGEISKNAAKEIINTCRKGVYWCDGNEHEAVDYIRDCVCGRCMKKLPKGEKMYSIYSVSWDILSRHELDKGLAGDKLCKSCFDIVLENHCKDAERGPKEREYIDENWPEEDCASTGEYKEYNNGYPWRD